MKNKKGISLIEILVAITLVSLAFLPLTGLLSSSNRMSNASIYEEMAIHYARELSDQLLMMCPRFPSLVAEAKDRTGHNLLDLATILNDDEFAKKITKPASNTMIIPLEVKGMQLPATLVLSPLDNAFLLRQITLAPMNTDGNRVFHNARFWKATIELVWLDQTAGSDMIRDITMVIFLREG